MYRYLKNHRIQPYLVIRHGQVRPARDSTVAKRIRLGILGRHFPVPETILD